MVLVRKAWFWKDVKESLRQVVQYKFPRPPLWVLENYYSDYMLWVSRVGSPEKEKRLEDTVIDWATILQVNPRIDYWAAVEESVYGECMVANEVPGVAQYLEDRERRLRL